MSFDSGVTSAAVAGCGGRLAVRWRRSFDEDVEQNGLGKTDSSVPVHGDRRRLTAFRVLEAPPFGRAMREKSILRRFSVEDAVA